MNTDLLKEIDRQISIALGMLVVEHIHEAKIQLATIHVGLNIVINAVEGLHTPNKDIDAILQDMMKQATEACKNGTTGSRH